MTENGTLLKNGVRLNLPRFKVLMDYCLDDVAGAVRDIRNGEEVEFKVHLGGNVMLTATSDPPLVSIRHYFKPEDVKEPVPTKKGVSFYAMAWEKVMEILQACRVCLGDFYEATQTCLDEDVHDAHVYPCPECQPEEFEHFVKFTENRPPLRRQ